MAARRTHQKSEQQRAVIYCRISKDRHKGTDKEGLGIERQTRLCRQLVREEGYTEVALFSDNDISGRNTRKRHGYLAVLDLVKRGEADTIVCYSIDRLTRSPRDLEDLVDVLNEAGTNVATIMGGDDDLTTPEGRAMARIKGNLARLEYEKMSKRLRDKHAEIAEAGNRSGGGNRMFGYEAGGLAVNPAEAAIFRTMVDSVLAGSSVGSVALWLNQQQVPTTAGGQGWRAKSVKAMLTNGQYAALREYEGLTYAANWPALMSIDELTELRALTNKGPARPKTASYLLTSLLRCGSWGHHAWNEEQ